MRPSRPFLLRIPGILIHTAILLAFTINTKYPSTIREKPCCGYNGAMRVNGHMTCANPSLSICWDDEVNLLSKGVDIGSVKKAQKHAVMKLFNDTPKEAEVVVQMVVSGIAVWGLISWFNVVKTMKEVLGPFGRRVCMILERGRGG
jgi:hypothetical protein